MPPFVPSDTIKRAGVKSHSADHIAQAHKWRTAATLLPPSPPLPLPQLPHVGTVSGLLYYTREYTWRYDSTRFNLLIVTIRLCHLYVHPF